MEVLINLLERKNLCFRSFHKLCHEFLDEITAGETTNLEKFQKRRQGLIKVLEQLEFEVTHFLNALGPDTDSVERVVPTEVKERIGGLLNEKDGIVRSIVDLDLQILSHIDRIKDDTIRKLQSLQAGRKTIGAYRSPLESIEIAENKKLQDREA